MFFNNTDEGKMKKICSTKKIPSLHHDHYGVVDGWCIFLRGAVVCGHKLCIGNGVNPIDTFERSDHGKKLTYTKLLLNSHELEMLRSLLQKYDKQDLAFYNHKKIKQHSQSTADFSRLSMSDMVIVINQGQPGNKHVCSERVILANEYFTPKADQILQSGSFYRWGVDYWCCGRRLFYKPHPYNEALGQGMFWVEGSLQKFHEKSVLLLRPEHIECLWKSRN